MKLLNEQIFYFFNSLAGQNSFLDSVIFFLANDLPWVMVFVTVVYFLFIKKSPKKFFMIAFMVGFSSVFTEILKWIIFRSPRPFVALSDVTQIIHISHFDSFPSQHAAVFAALATGVFLYNKTLGTWFFVTALLIGLARIAGGAHFPFDVLVGFLIGIFVSLIFYRAVKGFSKSVNNFIS